MIIIAVGGLALFVSDRPTERLSFRKPTAPLPIIPLDIRAGIVYTGDKVGKMWYEKHRLNFGPNGRTDLPHRILFTLLDGPSFFRGPASVRNQGLE